MLAKAAGDIASDTLIEEEDKEEATDPAGPFVPSANQLAGYFREGVAFSLEHDNPELFDLMTKATSLIEQQKWQSIKSAEQTSIISTHMLISIQFLINLYTCIYLYVFYE